MISRRSALVIAAGLSALALTSCGKAPSTPASKDTVVFSILSTESAQNMDKIKGATVNGVRPSAQTISDGSYPLSRTLFIYVKKANIGVTPGLEEFLKEFTSDAATGRGGYLQGRGLIPLPPGQHEAQKGVVNSKTTMGRPAA